MNIQLIYHSISKSDDKQVQEILKTARSFNGQHDITGCLLHFNLEFLQILEGESGVVLNLYERIKVDPRNSHVHTIYQQPFRERIFENWTMGYGHLAENDMNAIAKSLYLSDLNNLNLKSSESQNSVAFKLFMAISNQIITLPIDSQPKGD